MPICSPGEIVLLPNDRPSSEVALGEKPGGVCAVAVATTASTESRVEPVYIIDNGWELREQLMSR